MPADPIYETASATTDAEGKALARLGPRAAFETWRVDSITVTCESITSEPQARVYRGAESRGRLIGGTYSGNFDTDSAPNLTLQSGEDLIVVWTGADAGVSCMVTVQGERRR